MLVDVTLQHWCSAVAVSHRWHVMSRVSVMGLGAVVDNEQCSTPSWSATNRRSRLLVAIHHIARYLHRRAVSHGEVEASQSCLCTSSGCRIVLGDGCGKQVGKGCSTRVAGDRLWGRR